MKDIYPKDYEHICKDIFNYWHVDNKPKELTHQIFYDDDNNGVGIGFCANIYDDKDCIGKAVKVLETTEIKRWCTRLVIYRRITPYKTEQIFEKKYKPNKED